MKNSPHNIALFALILIGCDSGTSQTVPACPSGAWRVCVTDDLTWGRRWCDEDGWEPACHPPQCVPGKEEACTTVCGSTGARWCDEDGWWAPCVGEESCDGKDNDCDGFTDQGLWEEEDEWEPNDSCQTATELVVPINHDDMYIMLDQTGWAPDEPDG